MCHHIDKLQAGDVFVQQYFGLSTGLSPELTFVTLEVLDIGSASLHGLAPLHTHTSRELHNERGKGQHSNA